MKITLNDTKFEFLEMKEELTRNILGYVGILIFCLGFFGNTLIIIILNRSTSPKNITNLLVVFVALADLFVIFFCLLLDMLSIWDIFDITEVHQVGCKIFKFIEYTSMDTAVWLMCVFSVERFIYVCFPLKGRMLCRIMIIQIAAAAVVLLAGLKNVHMFWTRGTDWKYQHTNSLNMSQLTSNNNSFVITSNSTQNYISNCGYTSEYNKNFHLYYRPWIVVITVNVIPLLLLIICNTAIARKLMLHNKKWNNGGFSQKQNDKRRSSSNSLTIMCLVISVVFIIFTVPTMVLLVGKPYWTKSADSRVKYKIAQTVNNQLYFLNHSINFYLYLITVPSFRTETKRLLCCQSLPDRTSVTSHKVKRNFSPGCYSHSAQTSLIYGYDNRFQSSRRANYI